MTEARSKWEGGLQRTVELPGLFHMLRGVVDEHGQVWLEFTKLSGVTEPVSAFLADRDREQLAAFLLEGLHVDGV